MSMAESPRGPVDALDAPINELAKELRELRTLAEVEPPPWFVARVMTRLSEPRAPSFWEWLRRPSPIELRLSPLAMIGLVAALAAAFVYLGATLR